MPDSAPVPGGGYGVGYSAFGACCCGDGGGYGAGDCVHACHPDPMPACYKLFGSLFSCQCPDIVLPYLGRSGSPSAGPCGLDGSPVDPCCHCYGFGLAQGVCACEWPPPLPVSPPQFECLGAVSLNLCASGAARLVLTFLNCVVGAAGCSFIGKCIYEINGPWACFGENVLQFTSCNPIGPSWCTLGTEARIGLC